MREYRSQSSMFQEDWLLYSLIAIPPFFTTVRRRTGRRNSQPVVVGTFYRSICRVRTYTSHEQPYRSLLGPRSLVLQQPPLLQVASLVNLLCMRKNSTPELGTPLYSGHQSRVPRVSALEGFHCSSELMRFIPTRLCHWNILVLHPRTS